MDDPQLGRKIDREHLLHIYLRTAVDDVCGLGAIGYDARFIPEGLRDNEYYTQLVLKFQSCFLPHSTIDAGDVAFVSHVLLHHLEMRISDLDALHLRST